MLKALEYFDKLEDESRFKSWIFTIITNTYISYYRKRIFGMFISINEYPDFDRLPDVFPKSESDRMYDEIYLSLSKLKEKEKIALLLFEIGGFSLEEIRDIQNEKSTSAIKSRLSRARAKLKIAIDNLDKNKDTHSKNKSGLIENIEMETIKIIENIKPEI